MLFPGTPYVVAGVLLSRAPGRWPTVEALAGSSVSLPERELLRRSGCRAGTIRPPPESGRAAWASSLATGQGYLFSSYAYCTAPTAATELLRWCKINPTGASRHLLSASRGHAKNW